MENNLNKIAKDLYGKIQVRFPEIKIGDENAEVLSTKVDIPHARFFEFEYKKGDISVGIITITLDEEDGIVIQISQDIHKNDLTKDDDFNKFIRSFRKFAKNRLLNFDVQNIGKSNLDKRDYQFQAKPKELPIMESKMFGTNRISYQNLGETRLIVKHNQPINPAVAAGRSMHIQSIYIENADGERFKYPFKHLPGARALAEHVNHGGNPYDQIGKHITGLSEELNQLRKFKGYVSRQDQISESMGNVTNRVLERIEEVKKHINNLQKRNYYEQFVESFEESDTHVIPEDIMNEWVDRLTIRTFNEDLKQVFPYLYNIIDESDLPIRELGIDDLLDESLETYVESFNPKYNKRYDPALLLESFIESIGGESELNDTPESNELNDVLSSKLSGGDIGATTLSGLIKDPKIIDLIRNINFDDKEAEDAAIRDIISNYFLSHNPAELSELPNLYNTNPADVGGEDLPPEPEEGAAEPPAPAPMPGAAPAPAPAPMPGAAPMAESVNNAKIKAKFIKLKEAGATLDTIFAEGMTVADAIKECGLTQMECGFTEESPEETNESGVNQLLKIITGFWNSMEKNFTIGGQKAKIKVKKAYDDGECPNASDEDVINVFKFIDAKDPSEPLQSDEQDHVLHLAGVKKTMPHIAVISSGDTKADSLLNNIKTMKEQPISENELALIKRNAGLK